MSIANQDWYLYVHLTGGELRRVNISKLVCENSRPQLERQHIYGGDKDEGYLFKNPVTNTVHQFECSRTCCQFVTTIDSKLYVLVRSYINDDYNGRREFQDVFKVYDPFHGLWKILPSPPISDDTYPDYSYGHFEWGHMLGVFDQHCRAPSSYVFDTIEEKWIPAVDLPHLVCAVEFSGFLIGIEPSLSRWTNPQNIVAYKLDDENGFPDSNSIHTLDGDLWELFYPSFVQAGTAHLTRFGDDHVLFVCGVESYDVNNFILVAVFRVSVSTVGGLPVVRASFEHKQLYELDDRRSDISSTFLMQNAPSYRTQIRIASLPHIDGRPLQEEEARKRRRGKKRDNKNKKKKGNDDVAQTLADVEWEAGLMEKSLYMCFVENRTDCSVSYIIKAMKFSDLISTSSHDSNSKLHQVASTSGFHLACLPCCGVFGSLILFAGGADQDELRVLQPVKDGWDSDAEYAVEVVAQQVHSSRDIHFYNVASNDPKSYSNIKRFTKIFKGMKPQPVLAEVEGKLYALAGSPKPMYMSPGPFFEVFDPIEKEWSPLPDPPSYTSFVSSSNSHAIVGTNILAWGNNESPGVFRFDMVADSIDQDWRLIKNSRVFCGEYKSKFDAQTHQSTIVVDSDGNGGGDFVLFTHKNESCSSDLQVHLISREFDYVVCLPSLKLPKSVSSFLKAQHRNPGHSSFAHLGGRKVCLLLSCPFKGPYSRTVHQLAEVDKMSILILVFEFEVAENRESVAAEFVFHRMLEYDTNSNAKQKSKTSDAHMVDAFLL